MAKIMGQPLIKIEEHHNKDAGTTVHFEDPRGIPHEIQIPSNVEVRHLVTSTPRMVVPDLPWLRKKGRSRRTSKHRRGAI